MAHEISFDTLLDYAEGRLSEAERAAVAARLAANLAAADTVSRLTDMIALMRADNTVDAPAHLINRATRLLRQHEPAPESSTPPSLLRRILAALTFDSGSSLVLGMRSGTSSTRQLLYSAEGLTLDVRIAPDDHGSNGFVVSGQVLGPDTPGEIILASEAGSSRSPLNTLGEYTLPAVPAGRYSLTLRQGGLEIVVPELELGASPT